MSLPTHANYKPSGVEWLGLVPIDWKVCALGYRYDVALGKMLDAKQITGQHLAPYLRNVDVQWGCINVEGLPKMDFDAEDAVRYGLRKGDLLVCEGGEVGRAAIWNGELAECYYQKALHRVRPRSDVDNALFLFYALRAAVDQGVFSRDGGKTTIAHLPAEAFKRTRFAFPPLRQQVAIAEFLGRETSNIDALIAEQEKMLVLLAEKRQATISHAITRGLNPDAPTRDSCIPWLGEVPAHWDVIPLMHLVDPERPVMYGIVLPGPNVDDGIPIVKGGDVKEHRLKVHLLNRTTEEIEAPYARARLLPNDLVFSIRGTIGDVEVVPEELRGANITQDVARIAPGPGIQTRWLLYAMASDPVFVQLEIRSLGAAVRGINIYELDRARVPVPPAEERQAIFEFLDIELSKLDELVAQSEKAMGLLRERRSALISAAVTGKIDVRGLVSEREAA